jgi:hypothetical protein
MNRKGYIRLTLRHYHIICAEELQKTKNITETVILLFKFDNWNLRTNVWANYCHHLALQTEHLYC